MNDTVGVTVEAIRKLLDDVAEHAYRLGYADGIAGRQPKHHPVEVASVDVPTSSGRRSRLGGGQTDEWISGVLDADWQPVPGLVERIHRKFGIQAKAETIRAAAYRMARSGTIVKHRTKPMFAKKKGAT